MDNGRFFLRVSKEMPNRALVLVHSVYGVAQSWLVVVDGAGVGLRRSQKRFTSVWRFVHHYADPRQSELDIPLNVSVPRRPKVDWRSIGAAHMRELKPRHTRPKRVEPPPTTPSAIHIYIDGPLGYTSPPPQQYPDYSYPAPEPVYVEEATSYTTTTYYDDAAVAGELQGEGPSPFPVY
jgi:hypothetical protein